MTTNWQNIRFGKWL